MVFEVNEGETFQVGVFALKKFGTNIEFVIQPLAAPRFRLRQVKRDSWSSDRTIRLDLPLNSGLPYVVERSADLQPWQPVYTNANFKAHTIRVDSELTRQREFYRSRLLENDEP